MSFLTRRMHSLDGLLRHKDGIQLYLSPPPPLPPPTLLLIVAAAAPPFPVEDTTPAPLATPPASTPFPFPFALTSPPKPPFPLSKPLLPPTPPYSGAPPTPCALAGAGTAAGDDDDVAGGEGLAPFNAGGVSKQSGGVSGGVAGVGAAPGSWGSGSPWPVFFISAMVTAATKRRLNLQIYPRGLCAQSRRPRGGIRRKLLQLEYLMGEMTSVSFTIPAQISVRVQKRTGLPFGSVPQVKLSPISMSQESAERSLHKVQRPGCFASRSSRLRRGIPFGGCSIRTLEAQDHGRRAKTRKFMGWWELGCCWRGYRHWKHLAPQTM